MLQPNLPDETGDLISRDMLYFLFRYFKNHVKKLVMIINGLHCTWIYLDGSVIKANILLISYQEATDKTTQSLDS